MRLAYRSWLILLLLPLATLSRAQPEFPELTGRVVDNAGLLSPAVIQQLTQQLAAHEQQTSNQVVVVTLPGLQGHAIEDYGYQLGRHWGIGQKDTNTGVLLIVAPTERKVRIEVGYGLEGQLTDALSHDIIQNRILPEFRQGHYEKGIISGTESVLAVLGGGYEPVKSTFPRKAEENINSLVFWLIFLIVAGNFFFGRLLRSRLIVSGGTALIAFVVTWLIIGSLVAGVIVALIVFGFSLLNGPGPRGGGRGGWGGYYSGGGYSGGYSGGGFSGGGGSFGGGGASGGW